MTAPVSLAEVRLAHDGMTQHECARIGCTRLTSEQECALHAAEPAGVVHQEPRPAPTREEFERLVLGHRTADTSAGRDRFEDAILAAFSAVCVERRAALARADKAEAERDALKAALNAQGEIRLDIRGGSELRLRVGTLLQLHWKTLTNAQLDAIKAICDEALAERP